MKEKKVKERVVIRNKRARYDYQIEKTFDAGIVLLGEEIKSIRAGKVSIDNSYAIEKNNAIWIKNSYIELQNNYENKPMNNSLRVRKLLLNKKEIDKIKLQITSDGYTLVPINIFYNEKGFAKVKLGLSKGRKIQDKREYKKEQDWKKQKARMLKNIR